jgi:thiamine-monophosphate kinase
MGGMTAPEFALIDWIRRRAPIAPPVTVGIGDDAAVLDPTPGRSQVVTTDLLMEGVDFLWPQATVAQIGRKALGVNLSDIAAMAARPVAAFVSTALPGERGPEFARDLHAAILEMASEYGVTLAGGDTNTWDGPLVVSITVIGEPIGPRPILRSGARPGDWILVTGAFGGSILGRHLNVTPRLAEAACLIEWGEPRALIDVSDGLAADLHHILEASGVGAKLDAASIPIHPDACRMADGQTPLDHALGDGEDFELIAVVAPDVGELLLQQWRLATPLTKIGEITAGPGCRLVGPDGSSSELPPRGWSHGWNAPHT